MYLLHITCKNRKIETDIKRNKRQYQIYKRKNIERYSEKEKIDIGKKEEKKEEKKERRKER